MSFYYLYAAILLFLLISVIRFLIVLIRRRRNNVAVAFNLHEDGRHPHHRRPTSQSASFQPVPSRTVGARDLETGLYHTPKVALRHTTLFKTKYTPNRCRQYLSCGVSVLVAHQQYKLALHSIPSASVCTECVICLSEFEEADTCFVGRCMHVFHWKCANSWLSSNHSCPVCRSSVSNIVFSFIRSLSNNA